MAVATGLLASFQHSSLAVRDPYTHDPSFPGYMAYMSYPYQYLLPDNGFEMDLQPSGYVPSTTLPQQHARSTNTVDTEDHLLTNQTNPDSGGYLSSQDAGPQQGAISQPRPEPRGQRCTTPSGWKGRNKLGYHRTPLACGHCRQRKTRCIPSQADAEGRCVGCIRMRKSCSFYQKTPPLPTAKRRKSSSQTEIRPKELPGFSNTEASVGQEQQVPDRPSFNSGTIRPVPSSALLTSTKNSRTAESTQPESNYCSNPSANRLYSFADNPPSDWVDCDEISTNIEETSTPWIGHSPGSPTSANIPPYTQTPPSTATGSYTNL
ncbi:hypothetical protein G7046_g3285 [Stylonectria norvegica]|nr:hypothetical protein G7046_g3285 [Stylonectria norvegica]